uniref:Uncharacterized protein n=2 Tax=unclassified Caudoviricetes TaxID=2788787 RepID=A0A8S5Q0M5_9CAUD|nr:MAG TPA: hypothetical protein [Siphoviridae sp. ctkL634]DAE12369.1 MAG TPA: hypothetical protein [Siphoviridae sp. ctG0D7]
MYVYKKIGLVNRYFIYKNQLVGYILFHTILPFFLSQ